MAPNFRRSARAQHEYFSYTAQGLHNGTTVADIEPQQPTTVARMQLRPAAIGDLKHFGEHFFRITDRAITTAGQTAINHEIYAH